MPDARRFFCAKFGKVGGSAGPRPILPAVGVPVVNGVVVDVVEAGPEVAFGADGAVGATVEGLSAFGVLF